MPCDASASSRRASSRLLRFFTSAMTLSISDSPISTPSAATCPLKSRSATNDSKAWRRTRARARSRAGPSGWFSIRGSWGEAIAGVAGAAASAAARRSPTIMGDILVRRAGQAGFSWRHGAQGGLVDLDLRLLPERGEVHLLRARPPLAQELVVDGGPHLVERAALRRAAGRHLEEVEPVRRRRHLGERVDGQREAGVEHLRHARALAEPAQIASRPALRRQRRAPRHVGEALRAAEQLLAELLRLLAGAYHHLRGANLLRLRELLGVIGIVARHVGLGHLDAGEHLVGEELLHRELFLQASLELHLGEALLGEQVVEVRARVVGADPQQRPLDLVLADRDVPHARLLEEERPLDRVLEQPPPQDAVGRAALGAGGAGVLQLALQRVGRDGLAVHRRHRPWADPGRGRAGAATAAAGAEAG